jgi:hypothetical protein
VLRWPGRQYLYDAAGEERPAWHLTRGKRAWGQRQLWDGRRRCWRTGGVLANRAGHASSVRPLWLVVARRGYGESPWYLLTTVPADTLAQAWTVVHAHAQRWTIELSWRYGQAELALESPRLWTLERREKLLLLARLAYAFLLTLCVAPAAAAGPGHPALALPPHGQAEPDRSDSALPLALRAQPPVGGLSDTALDYPLRKLGMTHVDPGAPGRLLTPVDGPRQ